MKHSHFAALIALILLAACAPTRNSTPQVVTTTSTLQVILITATPQFITATLEPTATATVTSTPTDTPMPTATATPRPPTLRDWADRAGIRIGTEFTGWWFNNPKWRETVGNEFNLATIDWGIYWSESEPESGTFSFNTIDKEVTFAEQNHMRIRGMGLVVPSSPGLLPAWLQGLSRDQMDKAIYNHVYTIVSRYKGRIEEWTVVTEPYMPPYFTNDVFYKAFGTYDYITTAFKAARDADPSAKLIFEDDDNHTTNGKATNLTRQIVQTLKTSGLIDSVGIEMHLRGNDAPKSSEVVQTIQSYGVPVEITSVDVDMRNVQGSKEQRYQLQASIYADTVKTCLASGICKSFSVWGIGDKYSWLEYPTSNSTSPLAEPTPFDDDLNPKPAYFAMRDVLSAKGK
ncbi:MAG: endo-1,4-beta-xylanase [Chloroflexi bacterium]|nr:endo-1,4-beta-xylanase [Chloroflexota bacterium]